MAILYDLEHPTSIPHFTRCRPSSVYKLDGQRWRDGNLLLRWQPPRNRAPVSGYRIERTPDGKTYETIGETRNREFEVIPEPGEAWFYRVTAWNGRGATPSTRICFYRAADRLGLNGPPVKSLLQHFPATPGVIFTVCELVPQT